MLAHLSHRGVVSVTGIDRISLLNGIITQDALKISPTQLVFSAFLSPQGKFLYDLFLFEKEDAILIDVEKAYIGEFIRRLSAFRLRKEATIEETDYNVYGSKIASFGSQDIVMNDPRLSNFGVRIYTLNELRHDQISFDNWDQHRIEMGLPDGTRDIPYERGIILEYGFDELNAIDWQKGCYLGQELTARTRYRGLIRKRLLPIKIAEKSAFTKENRNIMHQGNVIGELCSFNRDVGLAHLYLEPFVANHGYKFSGLLYRDTPVQVNVPSWMRLPDLDESKP